MELGLIGLGRMGGDMAARLTAAGHRVVGFDLDAAVTRRAAEAGAVVAAGSLPDLVGRLEAPRAVWTMVPHGRPTRATVDALVALCAPGDVLVDGGNSRYTDSLATAARAAEHGIDFLDVGVSGGVWGREEGYCLMVGGPEAACARLAPIFSALAPADGWARVGGQGAGHFVKMVHNAIEYAQLQALGEGFHLMEASDYGLDLAAVARLWQHGSVVRSWLLELLARALEQEGNELRAVGAWVEDSGMGRWSVEHAVRAGVPIPAITAALYERFSSRQPERFSAKVIAALRKQFGGHEIRTSGT